MARRLPACTSILGFGFLLLLSGCLVQEDRDIADEPLPPCTTAGSLFENLPFAQWTDVYQAPIYLWADEYHRRVAEVIDAHVERALRGEFPLSCTAPDYRQAMLPTAQLQSLAATIPAWQDDIAHGTLSEADFGPVLTEFLRIYECGLQEHNREELATSRIFAEWQEAGFFGRGTEYDLLEEFIRRDFWTAEELLVARPALERALAVIGSLDLLQPFVAELTCIERASLDLRNILGLASDAAACMSRALDARASLRDFSL